jgi:hypothetical protein
MHRFLSKVVAARDAAAGIPSATKSQDIHPWHSDAFIEIDIPTIRIRNS